MQCTRLPKTGVFFLLNYSVRIRTSQSAYSLALTLTLSPIDSFLSSIALLLSGKKMTCIKHYSFPLVEEKLILARSQKNCGNFFRLLQSLLNSTLAFVYDIARLKLF
uniref:Uncharacterized protein n=1 Tax=Cacopsylla melanoneura TaxID=428564 RepID=A0A8D8X8Y3_9HEMI